MSPRGRRPGSEDTRGMIIDAARVLFADKGYTATSIRAVARAAGVDPRLVHHYFADKAALFVAVIQVPVHPPDIVAGVLAGPREHIGENLVLAFLTVWDPPERQDALVSLVSAAITGEGPGRMLREFVITEIFGHIVLSIGVGRLTDEDRLRAGLAAGQLIGMALLRYAVRYPPVARASRAQIAAQVGPVLQRYLVREEE